MRLIYEQTIFKVLVERTGILLSVTMKERAFYFFLSSKLFGIRTAPTTDPYPGIVEVCGYDIPRIVENWNKLANIKLRRKARELGKETIYKEYFP